MITLGLNAAFHDSAAVLVVNGVPVAAVEEERFTRVKHAKRPLPFTAWELPFHAIAWCLEQAGVTLAEVDHVAYSFDPWRFAEGRAELLPDADGCLRLPALPQDPEHPQGVQRAAPQRPWDSPWDPLFLSSVLNAPGLLADAAPHHLRARLYGGAPRAAARWQWHEVDHHLCHQASAFLAAPFERCAVMTLDGRGERATTSYGVWRDGRYRSLGEVRMPHSLGLLYEQVTSHLGFLHSSDEYKVMALAAMGRPRWREALAARVHLRDGGQLEIEPIDLAALAGPARVPGAPMLQQHLDLAASLQQVLEQTVLAIAQWLRQASGERALAMAGGVALNCVMNARLRDTGPFERIWVQPAAGDAGTALGAALWTDARMRHPAALAPHDARNDDPDARTLDEALTGWALAPRRWQMSHAYLGPAWDDDQIEPLLRWAGLAYEHLPDEAALAQRTAALLADDLIVGWFQGRMEWGPRALGARSILASPLSVEMQARLNELKDREDFRPVAPAVTAEAFGDWFMGAHGNGGGSPYMLFTHQVQPAQVARIPSACHSDGSARVQTVDAASNPRFHALLQAFGERTGVPVLVNTSFNVRGQPIVCSPKDALEAFFTTPLDALVIGAFVLRKPGVPTLHDEVRSEPAASPAPTPARTRQAAVDLADAGPRLSVVVPTCGRPDLLQRCLHALVRQSLPRTAFEIVVVDDGHDDCVRLLVQGLAGAPGMPALRYLRPSGGRGPAVARNFGWRAARGEVIAFTDDDTVPQPDWLAQGEAALSGAPFAALGGRVVVPGVSDPPTDHERMTQGLERTEFVTANAFVRRPALLQVGGFDERFTRAWREDSDLQFRLQDLAGPVGRCEQAVVLHPVRPERWGVSLRQQKNAYFEALLYAKHPQRYREKSGVPWPWDYYAIVALVLATLVFAGVDIFGSAVVSGLLAAGLTLRFALRRLRHTSHRGEHVLEMLATSALIPFLSVYWRLRGALHFRVWFL